MSQTTSSNKLFFLIICSCWLSVVSYSQTITTPGTSSQNYQPPVFTDNDRLSKIKEILPAIENIYKQYGEQKQFPGSAFGVVVDGKLIYTKGFGYADIPKKNPFTASSIFRVASISKSFTAMAILKLRDEGKLQLDAPAYQYIPELKQIKYLSSDAPAITVRDLLTHSAGFPEDNPWGDRQLADTDEELLNMVGAGVSFSNVPGVTYEYSNMGFALLGYIITKVSGKPYQQYITDNIFKPLDMTQTYWEYTKVPATQLAHGYRSTANGQFQEEALLHDGSYGAMGGILTTVEDLAKYIALQQAAWPPRNDAESKVMKRSSIREMHQLWRLGSLNAKYKYPSGRNCAMVSGYGYGLRISKDCDNVTTIGHSGGLPGFGSNWVILPDYGIGLIYFSNLTYAPASIINVQVMDTLLALTKLQPYTLPVSDILEKRKKELIQLLPAWQNAANTGIFAENFFPDHSLEYRKKQSADVFAKAGKIIRIREFIPQNQLRGSFIMEGEKANIGIYFTLTPEKNPLIQELHISELPR
ncbi:beta-lactamase family protein [Rhodocytophaga rosea]|uniref:Beta-lactamase family protein n=1 Tax=Rhodocytophaga rosea TaxID=2704465 RepID=A0A6C0GJ63_9BACT|nr:serine hydrolase domain-containing protein [Rhodocytophaga rosea]QHT67967.1 beta-lactamase family protein [Rhodocytophaga rosea]